MWQRTRSNILLLGAFLVLTLLTTPWLTLPYRQLDWVAFSQPYEPTPTATTTPTTTPAGPLPDLVITHAWVSMRGYAGGCVTEFAPLVTQVCVRNQGAAPAGAFLVRADAYGGGALEWAVGGLAAGGANCLEREAAAFGQVMVDADNDVIESDETNNTAFVPIPTPPPVCTPTPTLTPSPSYLPLVVKNGLPTTYRMDLLPEEASVGWVVSSDPAGHHFGDDDIYAGIWDGNIYLGAIQFDLSSLPADAVILDARLTLTGQRVIFSGDDGFWSVQMLQSSIDAGWPGGGYPAIAEAPSLGPLLDLEDGDFELDAGQLRAGAPSRLALTEPLVVELNHRLGTTNLVTFRIEGPKSGDNNLCLWDFGYDVGRLLMSPVLSLLYCGNSASSPAPTLAPTAHVP